MKPIAVVALGGNALIENHNDALSEQEKVARKAVKSLLYLYKSYHLILTHGNGPQVGSALLRSELAAGKAYSVPLDYCVAQSQGETGYLLAQAIDDIFGKNKAVAVLTRIRISAKDKAFVQPTKPIGDFYPKEKTAEWAAKGILYAEDAGRGYRRIVPSPQPQELCETDAIVSLVKKGHIVIAAGGGGIPVLSSAGGVEAVIDKDYASALLAQSVHAKLLFILTAVDAVYLDYLSPRRRRLQKATAKEAQKYLQAKQFPSGSMGPKIEAAITFLKHGGKKVIITDPEHSKEALLGKAGTWIVR